MNKISQTLGLVGWLFLSFSAGAVGGIASADAGAFYGKLVRPEWAPPSWVFAPVWSGLYALIGFAAWLVWRERGFRDGGVPLVLFIVQLAPNALWTWLFFSWRRGGLALADILIVWVLILITTIAFWRIRAIAGLLLVPYLLWVGYACALNLSLWKLNPSL